MGNYVRPTAALGASNDLIGQGLGDLMKGQTQEEIQRRKRLKLDAGASQQPGAFGDLSLGGMGSSMGNAVQSLLGMRMQ